MGSINLNIDDYSDDELIKLLSLPKKYELDDIDEAKTKLEKLLRNKTDMTSEKKMSIAFFLDSVGDRLKSGKLDNNNNNTGLWSESKNPTKEYGSNIVIENQNTIAGRDASIIRGRIAHTSTANPGYLNPVNVRTIRQCVAIDSRFRKNYFNTSSSKFTIDLPDVQTKCVSYRISSIKLPTTHYAISESLGNNTFIIHCNYNYAQLEGSRMEATSTSGLVNISSKNATSYVQYNYNCSWLSSVQNTAASNVDKPFSTLGGGGCVRMYGATKQNVINTQLTHGDLFFPPEITKKLSLPSENVGLPGDKVPAWKVTIPDGNYDKNGINGESLETTINNAISLAQPGWLDQESGFSQFHPKTTTDTSSYLNVAQDIYFTINSGSGRGVFLAPALEPSASTSKFENHGFTIRWLVNTSGNLDVDTPAQLRLGWQLGFRLGQYVCGGVPHKWTVKKVLTSDGFGVVLHPSALTGSWQPSVGSAISEGVVLVASASYCFLAINDYKTNTGPTMSVAYSDIAMDNNIIAKFNLASSIRSAGIYQYYDHPSSTTALDRMREFFGPVDISKLEFTLYDEYGRILNLNNMDWSLTLNFDKLYS